MTWVEADSRPLMVGAWQAWLGRESVRLHWNPSQEDGVDGDPLVADVTGFGFPHKCLDGLLGALGLVEESQPYRDYPARDPSPLPWGALIDGGRAYLFGPVVLLAAPTGPAKTDRWAWPPVKAVEVRYRDVPRLLQVLAGLPEPR